LSLVLAGLALVLFACGKREGPNAAVSVEKSSGLPLDRVTGRWQRTEGGYVIDIRGVESDGRLQADYFNPRPINVSKAMVAESGGALRVFIELRDAGYPGATYSLTYDPQADRLFGLYTQPAAGQTFDVVFLRMKR
jgi:hypothetical protein